ncbi:TIGR03986 family CRISPR-associated RAMP protein [Pantanalinema rosaneae CENA516]|uniref:TIGR03986 family type III CRISPR-associated RAMP protein n=1 Tax=Pantanalinema rosaneae TaxID=1620701 RepID=UPI003D6FDE6A
MSLPKHLSNVPPNRKAVAPYNFVELPDQVVTAPLPPDHDRYYTDHLTGKGDRLTGKIECTLTTDSPLYIRCGMTPADFEKYCDFQEPCPELSKGATENQKEQWMEQKKQWEKRKEAWEKERKDVLAPFFHTLVKSKDEELLPVIPGSSLRGMLRNLVEIVSFSKIERVSGHQRLFFRAVGSNPNKESWGKEYKTYVDHKQVQAGYLKEDTQGWYIQPAIRTNGVTFAWVQENELTNLPNFKKFNDDNYRPQYLNVNYQSLEERKETRNGKVIASRWFVQGITLQGSGASCKLVTSGNMKQGNESSPRSNHCIVFTEDANNSDIYRLDQEAVEHYRNALTDFQKVSPFNKDWGVLERGRPVFYLPPKPGSNIVSFFGQSPNFRIPYSPQGDGHATTVMDFVPKDLRKLSCIDLADAIFGWIKKESEEEKLSKNFDQQFGRQRAGRVFFTDGLYQSSQQEIWYENKKSVVPKILAEPKSTSFSHYLVQPETADPLSLKHYASQGATVIRGHKLYWHQGNDPTFKLTPSKKVIGAPKKVSDTQTTLIQPINKGVVFKFNIYFENLSNVELGCLLWVLDFARDTKYRLSLGMGKPLGMGAVKIEHQFYLSDRTKRYNTLFNEGNAWETGYSNAVTTDEESNYIAAFENFILQSLGTTGSFKELRRIKMLLAMLTWKENLSQAELDERRYMEIERDANLQHIGTPKKGKVNEYADRPVLPTPLQIMGCDDGDDDNNPNPGNSGGGNTPKPNPRLPRGSDRPKPKPGNSSSNQGSKTAMELALERAQKKPKRK